MRIIAERYSNYEMVLPESLLVITQRCTLRPMPLLMGVHLHASDSLYRKYRFAPYVRDGAGSGNGDSFDRLRMGAVTLSFFLSLTTILTIKFHQVSMFAPRIASLC